MGRAEVDGRGRPVVVVTGTGVVTSLGAGKPDNWRELTAGHSGVRRISRFPIGGLRTNIAGTVDFVPVDEVSAPALSERIAELVIDEALTEAGIGAPGDFPGPMFLALPPVEMEWPQRLALAAASGANETVTYDDLLRAAGTGKFTRYYERFLFGSVAENLAARFGTKGSPVATSTACASGATAIQLGVEALRRGEAEAALVVGTDASVNPESLIRFSLLSALSTRNDPPQAAARPFSKDRDGFVMAEGGGALVLETLAHARARGATVLGVVEGCGEMADGFHRTRSSPDGKPIIACMRGALEDAGLAPDAIGYVNAHGTGTPENDKMEWVGVSAVFGERAGAIPISSNKSMIGHTLTAAGTVEAIFTLLAMRHGRLPPTINYETPDPALPVDCVPNVARDAQVYDAISNSFGFGGQNVCLVIGLPVRVITPDAPHIDALQLLADRDLALVRRDLPPPPARGEVQLRVRYVGLNHIDVWGFRGMAFAKRRFPLSVGAEAACEVVAVGDGVTTLAPGDRVVPYAALVCGICPACTRGRENLCENVAGVRGFHVDGFAQTLTNHPARLTARLPDSVELRDAACVAVAYATVEHMLFDNARLEPGEWILVHAGGSGIGSIAIRVAKALGCTVITTVGSDDKAVKARSLGADHVINYRADRFEGVVRKLTARKGVDVVFEHVGADTWNGSLLSLKRGGRLVMCGATSGPAGSINLMQLFQQQYRIIGSFGSPLNALGRALDRIAGGVRPVIDTVYPLADFHTGLARLESRDVFGKLLVEL